MPPQKISEPFRATRITYTSTAPYATAISRLEKEFLSRPASTHNNLSFLFAAPPSEAFTPEIFKSNVRAAAGPHGFMQLHAFNHGDLLALHGLNGGRGLQRILVGNPLTAVDVLSRDLRVALSAPVDMLIMENEAGGTSVVWRDPLIEMTALNSEDEELVQHVTKLANGLEKVVIAALEERSALVME
jgi:uncharacterized protein (DUF302 family)